MADENKDGVEVEIDGVDTEVVTDDVDGNVEVQSKPTGAKARLAEIEEKAREQGWRPIDEWDGDPDEWRDARAFLDRGELLSRISNQSKELKELRKVTQALADHNKKVDEAAYERALATLKSQKLEALENAEHKRVLEIDEQISEMRDQFASQKANNMIAGGTQTVHPELAKWIDGNQWYAQNTELRTAADAIGTAYAAANPDLSPSDVLKHVEQKVKRLYPENFKNTRREEPSTVEGSTRRTTGRTKSTEIELTDDERRVMNTLVKGGHITKEKYMKDIADTRDNRTVLTRSNVK